MGVVTRAVRLAIDLRRGARHYNLAALDLARRMAKLTLGCGIAPRKVLVCGLLDPAVPDRALAGCIGKKRLLRIQRSLNPRTHVCLTEDKAVFYGHCQALGLPVPRLYAMIGPGVRWRANGSLSGEPDWERLLTEDVPSDFVLKPATGVYGHGFHAVRRTQSGFVDGSGAASSAADLLDLVRRDRRYDRYLVQERLWNHPELERLSGTRFLQTVRLITLVQRDGTVRSFAPFFRVIIGDNTVDNLQDGQTGNLPVAVAMENGRLLPARAFSPDLLAMVPVVRHPGTGQSLEGFAIPHWEEAKRLVERAARLFLPLRTIGWDVAITAGGPVLVEGNAWWDPPNWTPRVDDSGMAPFLELLRAEAAAVTPRRRA